MFNFTISGHDNNSFYIVYFKNDFKKLKILIILPIVFKCKHNPVINSVIPIMIPLQIHNGRLP